MENILIKVILTELNLCEKISSFHQKFNILKGTITMAISTNLLILTSISVFRYSFIVTNSYGLKCI